MLIVTNTYNKKNDFIAGVLLICQKENNIKMFTQEDRLDYNVNEAIKKFKEQTDIESTGEDLINDIYDQIDIFGEIMMETIEQSLGSDFFE